MVKYYVDMQVRQVTAPGEDIRQVRFTAEGDEVVIGDIPRTGENIHGIDDANVTLAVNSLMLDKTTKDLYILNEDGWAKWTTE